MDSAIEMHARAAATTSALIPTRGVNGTCPEHQLVRNAEWNATRAEEYFRTMDKDFG
jgi:hypothetical protein